MGLCCRRVRGNDQAIPPYRDTPHGWNELKVQAIWMIGCALAGGQIGRLTVHLYGNYIRDYFKLPHAPIEAEHAQMNGSVVGGVLGGHLGKWLAKRILQKPHAD